MKNFKKLVSIFAVVIMFANIAYAEKFNWSLTDNVGDLNISYITCDSITYEVDNDIFYQILWKNGTISERKSISYGYSLIPQAESLEYSMFSVEEDGEDAVKTSNGSLAIFLNIPDENDYILIIGSEKDNSTPEFLIFDETGLLKQIYADEELNNVYYLPSGIWLSDSQGNFLSEIPYSVFDSSFNTPERILSKATVITRNPISEGLNLYKNIRDYINKPMSDKSMDLLRNLNFGNNRHFTTLAELLEALSNIANINNLLSLLDHLNELQFFDNAYIKTLSPEKISFSSATLPCEVVGLSNNPNICHYAHQQFETVVNFDYTLYMTVTDGAVLGTTIDKQNRRISNNGRYDFTTTNINKINHTYYYEPSLTMNVTIDVDRAGAYNAAINDLPPGAVIPSGHYQYSRKCTIYGDRLSFKTPSVSSSISDIKNIKQNSCDIECSFSDVPQGANTYILIQSLENSSQIRVNTTANKSNQIVSVGGLETFTQYMATSYIEHSGNKIPGNTQTFTTDLPDVSGSWKCVQRNWSSITQKYTETTYTITLNKDGSVLLSNNDSIVTSSWSYSGSKLSISIMDLATQTYNHGLDWSFTPNDPKNPTTFTGTVTGWNYGPNGWHGGDGSSCTLSR